MFYRVLEFISRTLKEQERRTLSFALSIWATKEYSFAQAVDLIARVVSRISKAMSQNGLRRFLMRTEIIYSSIDLLVASCNSLAKSHNVRPDGVFTVDMLRSRFALFLLTQDDGKLSQAFSEFALSTVARDKKTIEEVYDELDGEGDIQGHPV
jgi:hypothetical protein